MTKILFIMPPNITFDSFINPSESERTGGKGKYGSVLTDPPLGILSMSAYLKKNIKDIEVKFIDYNVLLNKTTDFNASDPYAFFYSALKEYTTYNPDIVAISSLFSPSYKHLLDIGKLVKEMFQYSIIIAGGGIPTNLYERIFKESNCFDALCYGEGEIPLLELVKAEDRFSWLTFSSSWITRDKVEHKQEFKHSFIENLDEIPFLDYGLLNLEDYKISPILSLFPLAPKGKRGMSVITSRGCTHHCCFCSSHTVHGRKMRYQSLMSIREDFTILKERYGAEVLVFFDDHLMSDKKRAHEIFNIMRDLELTAFFPSSLALYALDYEMLSDLKSIGVDELVLSVESGSNRVLKEIMHKPLNLDIVKRVVSDCRKLDIASDVYVLMGLPGETLKDIEDARQFLKTTGASWTHINIATPLVGSEMLDICMKNGYIKRDYIDCNYKKAIVTTPDFTAEDIQEVTYSLNLELNFVENSDMKLGNYEVALKEFENVIKIKSDHAFALYYAAKCCGELGLHLSYSAYMEKYLEVERTSSFWGWYIDQYNLPRSKERNYE